MSQNFNRELCGVLLTPSRLLVQRDLLCEIELHITHIKVVCIVRFSIVLNDCSSTSFRGYT